MWLEIQIAAYASITLSFALLLLLAVRNRIQRGPAQSMLEAMLVLVPLWTAALGLLLVLAPGWWWAFTRHRLGQYGLVALAALTAALAEAYVGRAGRRWPLHIVVGLLTLGAAALDLRPFPFPDDLFFLPWAQFGPTELASLLLLVAWAVSMLVAWLGSAWALRRTIGSKHRNRIHYLRAALLIFTLGDLLIFAGGPLLLIAGLVARLFGSVSITFALLRYDLPNLRRLALVVVRVILMALLTAVVYLAAVLVAALLTGGFGPLPRLSVTAPAIALALLLAALVDVALAPRLQRAFDRTVLGRTYDAQRALRTYRLQIGPMLDVDRLGRATLDWLRTWLRVQRSALVLFSDPENGYIELSVQTASYADVPPPQRFEREGRFVQHFYKVARPLNQYDLDMLSWFQNMPEVERQWLSDLQADHYVPVLGADKPLGLLALGARAEDQAYSDDDLETLLLLAGQLGAAIDNVGLVERVSTVQSDLQKLGDELAETNKQLQRLDKVKSDFVTIASHELRTPLSAIFGYSDVLATLGSDEFGDSEVVEEFIKGISRGAERLRRVVDAMVDVSLLDAGALQLQTSFLPLGAIIQSGIDAARAGAEKRSQILTVGELDELPRIAADGARLAQVFAILVNNAIKFTPDGGEIVIQGRLVSSLTDREEVEVTVRDQGIGIDPDQHALVFEKFYRPENPMLHSSDDTGFMGAGPGLGLPIARGIVNAHGGRIWAESPGRDKDGCPGSTFYVRLPVSPRVEE